MEKCSPWRRISSSQTSLFPSMLNYRRVSLRKFVILHKFGKHYLAFLNYSTGDQLLWCRHTESTSDASQKICRQVWSEAQGTHSSFYISNVHFYDCHMMSHDPFLRALWDALASASPCLLSKISSLSQVFPFCFGSVIQVLHHWIKQQPKKNKKNFLIRIIHLLIPPIFKVRIPFTFGNDSNLNRLDENGCSQRFGSRSPSVWASPPPRESECELQRPSSDKMCCTKGP